ncbi:MAG: DEAD/DEAH box helicase [Pseudonocardiaceae bacterium]
MGGQHQEENDAVDTTVAGIADARWAVRPEPASERFEVPGWWYEEPAPLPCPTCAGELHALRKLYEGPNRTQDDKPSFLVAVICPGCPATFTLRDLGQRSYAALMGREAATKPRPRRSDAQTASARRPAEESPPASTSPRRWLDCDVAPGGVRVRTIPADHVHEFVAELLGQPGTRVIAGNLVASPQPVTVVEQRLLHWCKITDPAAPVPAQPAGVDVRLLLPLAPEFAGLSARLHAAGVSFRQVRYWWEAERISTVSPQGDLVPLRVMAELPANSARGQTGPALGWPAAAARDAFEMLWDVHAGPPDIGWEPVNAAHLVPDGWVRYLPYTTLNPAQAHAVPAVLGSSRHVVVTAPTGAGKTVIGMLAALKAILGEHRKAAWLVPQRSLTDELDRDLAAWRSLGLRVERLSGEYVTDVEKVRVADLWVATTEKFEAICRASSLRTALAEVACFVVDEIHLLGDPTRGPLLEALLARVRGEDSPVRILALSATVANADHIAGWLGAQLVHIAWRPSRLTWQLPMIPASSDRMVDQTNRTKTATAITTAITQDGGSVLVFCGSKRNVRATALAIAAARGADTRGVDHDDLARLHRVCTAVGVGLHYKDWEHKREAERAFRARELDVLVATTTVAAGVNLPARAVVVRDTQIGLNEIDVATVQQMFGRAGRIGAGETEGWAYLITDETERPGWQAQLVAGYTVTSRIADSLADHILAEAAQDRIHTLADAENWWIRTLAYHQGTADLAPVHAAVAFLIQGGYLAPVTDPDEVTVLTVTELGMLTTRLMVPVVVGAELRAFLTDESVPANPEDAEQLLGQAIATLVPQLAEAPVSEVLRPLVTQLLRTRGHLDLLDDTPAPPGLAPPNSGDPGDLAQVAFALVANSPRAFTRSSRAIAGLPISILYPILAEAPRYFAWLAAQGQLGAVHPWIAVVANDLGRRIRWRRLAPTRGSGRLLWICEQMATPAHADTVVPDLFTAARHRDITAPDWPVGRSPGHCRLDQPGYLALLRDRATDTAFTEHGDRVTITCPNAATVTLWTHQSYQVTLQSTAGEFEYPKAHENETHPDMRGATVFTRRGDHQSLGWLSTYNAIHEPH